jgi:hypothetical protein
LLNSEIQLNEKKNNTNHKIAISSCSSIKQEHLLLRYNMENENYEIKALALVCLNGKNLTEDQGFTALKPMDQLHFLCSKCYMPHLFYVVLPTSPQDMPDQIAAKTVDPGEKTAQTPMNKDTLM